MQTWGSERRSKKNKGKKAKARKQIQSVKSFILSYLYHIKCPNIIGIKSFLKKEFWAFKTLYELYLVAKHEDFTHSNIFNDHKFMPEKFN